MSKLPNFHKTNIARRLLLPSQKIFYSVTIVRLRVKKLQRWREKVTFVNNNIFKDKIKQLCRLCKQLGR